MKSIFAIALFSASAWAGPRLVSLKTVPEEATLRYAGAAQQFLAIATYDDGTERDVTSEAEWRVSNPDLASFTGTARLAAKDNGSLTITAALSPRAHAQSAVRIEGSSAARPFRFARDIGGILTKRGCNQAACHGGVKGRGGLKLSGQPADFRHREEQQPVLLKELSTAQSLNRFEMLGIAGQFLLQRSARCAGEFRRWRVHHGQDRPFPIEPLFKLDVALAPIQILRDQGVDVGVDLEVAGRIEARRDRKDEGEQNGNKGKPRASSNNGYNNTCQHSFSF